MIPFKTRPRPNLWPGFLSLIPAISPKIVLPLYAAKRGNKTCLKMSVQNFITFYPWEVHPISPRMRHTFSYRFGFFPLTAWGWAIILKFKPITLQSNGFITFLKHRHRFHAKRVPLPVYNENTVLTRLYY